VRVEGELWEGANTCRLKNAMMPGSDHGALERLEREITMRDARSAHDTSDQGGATRREFLRTGSAAFAAAGLAGLGLPRAFAQEDNTLRLALIGSGGRGTGAVVNALEATGGPVELYAVADVFEDRLKGSLASLTNQYEKGINVPPERQFLGFDAYKKAIDSLRPGDIVMLTALCYSRPLHVEYAVEKGVHVFMEKPFAPDSPGLRRILAAGEAAKAKNLKIGAGLMCRHSPARQAMIEEVRNGRMGEIETIRAYRMTDGVRVPPRNPDMAEIEWQIRYKHDFFWVSSGRLIDYMIHQVDECCWLMDAWPVEAHGLGGRVGSNASCGQNLDTYAIEYTYADGRKALVNHRDVPGCFNDFATYVHGTTCAGQFSGSGHQARVRIFTDQQIDGGTVAWAPEAETRSPWQAEWDVLLDAIRNDTPHNETERAVYSDLASIMGRAAVHTGKIMKWDETLNSEFSFFPEVDTVGYDGPSPIQADDTGHYPVPIPGEWTGL
jgi:predicted dehydrogenase